jgi:hypothetical protein
MYIIRNCNLGGNSISKNGLFWPRTEIAGGLGELGSKSYKELELENKVAAMERSLRDSENTCSAQKVQIADLHYDLCEANRSIMDLEKRNNLKKVALAVLGILFTSSLIITCFPYQSNDLFISCYLASKNGLNALLTNPLFHKLYGMKISGISLHFPLAATTQFLAGMVS